MIEGKYTKSLMTTIVAAGSLVEKMIIENHVSALIKDDLIVISKLLAQTGAKLARECPACEGTGDIGGILSGMAQCETCDGTGVR